MDKKRILKEYLFVAAGTTVLAMGINMFYEPNQLVIGGITGLGIVIDSYAMQLWSISIPLSVTNLILNLPLLLAAYYFLGKAFLGKTVFGTLFLSAALLYTKIIPVFSGDMTLIAVYGGVVCGAGLGLVFRGMGTTGGTDLAAAMIHRFYNHISVSKAIFSMDAFIIVLGFFVFGSEKAMYAIISVYISSKCIDTILEGMSFSKAAFIISEKSSEISNSILMELERGVTALHGRGMYTEDEKDILLCVFSQKEITKVKELVQSADENAFILLTDVKEVLGEGFSEKH